jgi:hypothetical protein
MRAEPGLAAKVELIHDALDRSGIPHAIGGALALAYYGEPRVTVDVDVNLFIGADEFGEVASILGSIGVNTEADPQEVERDGQVRLWWDENPIDLFFAYDSFHRSMGENARVVPFGDGTLPILAPEHLIVCKSAFDRTKDWLDIEQMVIAVPDLDRSGIDRWLDHVLGPGDERIDRFSRLWDEYR